jgi:hypothetical protein
MDEACWTKTKKLAPFNKKTGSLLSYYSYPPNEELLPADKPFPATLLCHDFDKGWRSAHRVIWLDEATGKTYPMFVGKFLELVKRHTDTTLPTFPRVTGWWGYCKRGANYGIEFIGEEL